MNTVLHLRNTCDQDATTRPTIHSLPPVTQIVILGKIVDVSSNLQRQPAKHAACDRKHFNRMRNRAHNRGCALQWVNHIKPKSAGHKQIKPKQAHRGINQAYCRVYHPAMTSDLTLHYNVTRDKNNRQRSVP